MPIGASVQAIHHRSCELSRVFPSIRIQKGIDQPIRDSNRCTLVNEIVFRSPLRRSSSMISVAPVEHALPYSVSNGARDTVALKNEIYRDARTHPDQPNRRMLMLSNFSKISTE